MTEPKLPDDFPRAVVRTVDNKMVLDDPDGRAVAEAVAKHNCLATAKGQRARILHFVLRMVERELGPHEVVITCINVDAQYGQEFADLLMPGHDWQSYRDRGEIPFARGLACRPGLQEAATLLDPIVGAKMKTIPGVVVFVVDHGVLEVFPVVEVVLP